MTEKRYYYTDHLAAMWMNKHFGMEFQLRESYAEDSICRPVFSQTNSSGVHVQKIAIVNGKLRLLGGEPLHPDEKLYVNPESLHLLEPKEGDFMLDEKDGIPFKFISIEKNYKFTNAKTIIRNGIPFMWPEVEQ